jgi:hypothetical protein
MLGKTYKLAIASILVLGAWTLAEAADFAPRKELAQRSAKEGLGREQLPLLTRTAAPGRERALDALTKSLGETATDAVTTRGKAKTETEYDRMLLSGAGWYLRVDADGSRASYRNVAYLDGPANAPVPIAKRLPQDQLEVKARQFIMERLRTVVSLGSNEELVPLFAEYQIGGGGSTKLGAAPDPEYVAGGTVVFGRTVSGVHVIGPGSKVAIMFTNDGKVAGFDYDWAAYARIDKAQKVVPMSEIRARAKRLTPIDLDQRKADVERIECGYFDLGVRRRDAAAPVQAACAIHAVTRRVVDQEAYKQDAGSGHVLAAQTFVVPAGDPVMPDAKWPQAQRLLGMTPAEPEAPQQGPKEAASRADTARPKPEAATTPPQ